MLNETRKKESNLLNRSVFGYNRRTQDTQTIIKSIQEQEKDYQVRVGSVERGRRKDGREWEGGLHDGKVYAGVVDMNVIKILDERKRKADPSKYYLQKKKNDQELLEDTYRAQI